MTIRQWVLTGDSIPYGGVKDVGVTGAMTMQGGQGSTFQQVARLLSNAAGFGPRVGTGLIGVWQRYTAGSMCQSTGTAPTAVTTSDAFDKGPYGSSAPFGTLFTTGYSNDPTTNWRFLVDPGDPPVVGFAIDYVDLTSGADFSYRKDGGTWTATGQTMQQNNDYCRAYYHGAVKSYVDIRAANSGGTGALMLPIGVHFYFADPRDTTVTGFIGHNLAVAGTQLHELVASGTAGNHTAFWTAVRLTTGWNASTLAATPDSGTFVWHINDVLLANAATWATDLGTLNTICSTHGGLWAVNGWEAKTSIYASATQTTYRAQTVTTMGASKVLDLYNFENTKGITGNTPISTAGFLLIDLVHPSQAGQTEAVPPLYWFVRNALSIGTVPTSYPVTAKAASPASKAKAATAAYAASAPVKIAV